MHHLISKPFVCIGAILLGLAVSQSEAATIEADGETKSVNFVGSIVEGDRDKLLTVLKKNKDAKTINLTSSGGLINEAIEMSDLIIDFGLDTNVVGECVSACGVYLHLAGKKRSLELGSKIGYHRAGWSYESIKSTYEDAPEDYENDIYKFAIWVDEVALEQVFRDLKYLLERGVTPNFAIKTLQAEGDDMWYPRRSELIAAGVLRD